MKGKLLINQSYNTITLDNIVLKPNTSTKVSLEEYDRLMSLTELKNYINIGYIVVYDTTLPNPKTTSKKDKIIPEDNKINISENNTIPSENITTNNVYNTYSENTIDAIIDTKTSLPKEVEKPISSTEEPKTKRRGGRRKKK